MSPWWVLGGISLFVFGFVLGLGSAKIVVILASNAITSGKKAVELGTVKRDPSYNGDEKAADWEEKITPRAPREFIPRR